MPRAKNTIATITKRRQQLTRQLGLQMMDRKENGKDTPGLLTKLMQKLEGDLDSDDEELRHKAMDKIIKLMPFVIAKEKAPAVQLNVMNNTIGGPQITAGKSTSLAVGTIHDYLKKRDKRMIEIGKVPTDIIDGEITEVEIEEEE